MTATIYLAKKNHCIIFFFLMGGCAGRDKLSGCFPIVTFLTQHMNKPAVTSKDNGELEINRTLWLISDALTELFNALSVSDGRFCRSEL